MSTARKVGVIHTSPATIELFTRLIKERMPDIGVINLLDDSILPELRDNGCDLAAIEPRWRNYARIMSEQGVDLVLNACSSIGELCARVQADIPQPIVRVDAGMTREAVARGTRIGVLATVNTTLKPTCDLLRKTAQEGGRIVDLDGVLVEGAYAALMQGDQARHDDLIASALDAAARSNDVVVLAQASMARVLPRLEVDLQTKVLTSPPFAVSEVVGMLQTQ
jgi:Asp/Glu/hydantoin racemase